MSLKDNKLATRRNALIEARFKLSVQEQRLMLWVISEIEPQDTDFKTYRVNIKELANRIGIKNKDFYTRVRNTTKKLMGRVIEIEEGARLIQTPLINKADYHTDGGTVDIRLDEDLKKYLLQLKEDFTSIKIKYAFELSSAYAIRLYELLTQYKRLGERVISVEDLRFMLDIDDKSYNRWSNFEARVIRFSQEEINTKTDIKFEYEKLFRHRKIYAVKFTIFDNRGKKPIDEHEPNTTLLSAMTQNEVDTGVERLFHYGIDKLAAEKLVKKHSANVIEKSIGMLETKLKDGELQNPAGWLMECIKGNWEDSKEKIKEEKEREKDRNRKEKLEREKNEREQEERNSRYREYFKRAVGEAVEKLKKDERDKLRTELVKNMPGIMREKYRREKNFWSDTMLIFSNIKILRKRFGIFSQEEFEKENL